MTDTVSAVSPSLDERLAARAEGWSPGIGKVVSYLHEHREEAAFLSAADIAGQLEVSDATVIRAVQALGYRGLGELRHELRDALRGRRAATVGYGQALDMADDGDDVLLDQMFTASAQTLAETRRAVSARAYGGARERLTAATRVVVFGHGPRAPLAHYTVQTLRRFGRSALPVTEHGHALVDALTELRSGDVLLALAYGEVTADLDVTLEHAADLGVPVVLVTDRLGFALRDRCTVAVVTGAGTEGRVPSVIGSVAVIEALLLGVLDADRPGSMAGLRRLDAMRERLRSSSLDPR